MQTALRRVIFLAFLLFAGAFYPKSALTDQAVTVNAGVASHVLPYALMSETVYSDNWIPIDTPGWTRIGNWQQIFTEGDRANLISRGAASGFYGAVFANTSGTISSNFPGTITIAYRGTTTDAGLPRRMLK